MNVLTIFRWANGKIQERPEFIPDKACVLRAEAANRPKVELLREKELELDVSTFSTKSYFIRLLHPYAFFRMNMFSI